MEVFSKPMNKIIRTLTKELPKIANSSTRYPNEYIYESEIISKPTIPTYLLSWSSYFA